MNKYIIPYCNISKSIIGNHVIIARSYNDCKDKLIRLYEDYSESDDWEDFLIDLEGNDIILGEITDIESL